MYFKYSSSASSWPCVNTGCFISCMSTINSVGHEPWCHTSICPSPDNTGNFHEPENDTALSYNLVGRLARETISSHMFFFDFYFIVYFIHHFLHYTGTYILWPLISRLKPTLACLIIMVSIIVNCVVRFLLPSTRIYLLATILCCIFSIFSFIFIYCPPFVIFISCPCYIYESPFLYLFIALFYIYPLPLLYLCLAPNYIYSLSPQAVIFMHCPLLYL